MTVLTVGIRMQVLAELGLAPWDVMHMGLHLQLPITFGQASQGVGAVLVAGAFALGEPPRLGTLLNMWYVGALYDQIAAAGIIHEPSTLAWRWAYIVGGVALLAAGSAWYMSAGLGSGPRDSLTLALSRRLATRRQGETPAGLAGSPAPTGRQVGGVRAALEAAATAIGWFLGGPVGPATVVAVLLIGPGFGLFVPWFSFARRWWQLPGAGPKRASRLRPAAAAGATDRGVRP